MRETGKYQKLGDLNYFIPQSLPPKNPPLLLNAHLMNLYGEASFALGQLNEMTERLPNTDRFIKAYVLKEALLSSAIEGINTTLIDAFTHTIGESKPNKETQLVLNYTKAMNIALDLIQNQNLPLVNRVILKAHHTLLQGEGEKSAPGLYRQQAVQVGDLIPPPPNEVTNLMGNLEKYINEESELPALIKAGLVHVQFETIHPFLDGNGRIGRLLIILMLIQSNILKSPILYLSYYFKKNHLEYYQRLSEVRTKGSFENWIIFYLKAIKESAEDAYKRAKDIEKLEDKLKQKIYTTERLFKIRENASLTLEYLFTSPIASVPEISKTIGKSFNTVNKIVDIFIDIKILKLKEQQKRNKLFQFIDYLDLLNKEY